MPSLAQGLCFAAWSTWLYYLSESDAHSIWQKENEAVGKTLMQVWV